jgi:hypothetical protein
MHDIHLPSGHTNAGERRNRYQERIDSGAPATRVMKRREEEDEP